jgi:DNA polymerase-1
MNIPLEARRLVVPRDGFTFLYPDMAQIEARVAAVLSKDKNLLAAFNEPVDWPGNPRHGTIDSHTKVMQLLAEQGVVITRDQSKRFTYAGIFGGGAQQLAVELNAEAFRKGEGANRLTTEQVQRALDTFFRVFNGLRKWQSDIADEVLRTRKLRNPLTGREFTWTGYIMDQKTKELKHEIAKQVWSRLPQDTAAYVLALGLIDIYYNTDYWGNLLQPLIHVHDALIIEVPIADVELAKTEARRLLTKELWGITFEVEMKQGNNWYIASGGK